MSEQENANVEIENTAEEEAISETNEVSETHELQSERIAQLEREGDFAADYLEGFLDTADFDGDLNLGIIGDRPLVSLTGGGEKLERISSPHITQALQVLTRVAVQVKTGEVSQVLLDIEGSRQRRVQELHDHVHRGIRELNQGKEKVYFGSMSSYERKVMHDYIAEQGYMSYSVGEGSQRRLVMKMR